MQSVVACIFVGCVSVIDAGGMYSLRHSNGPGRLHRCFYGTGNDRIVDDLTYCNVFGAALLHS